MKCISIVGNLGANAVRRVTSDGKELMTFSVAVSDGKSDTLWFNCVSNMRERQFDWLLKGQCVAVTGDLYVGIYQGKPDLAVNVDRLELCGNLRSNAQVSTDPLADSPI